MRQPVALAAFLLPRTTPSCPLPRPLPSAALAAAIALTVPLPALAATSKPTELDRVQVKVSTATRSERLLSDVPIRTEVLRKEDIALRAATDFSRAAELINGLRVESNCQNCNTSEVQLLGLPGAYNQLLFDGIPLLSTLGSVYGLEQIPAGFVDRVEVVKGGGSALYGPDAVAGVINLIPPLPARSGGHVQAGVDVLKGTPQKNADVRLDLVAKDADAGLSVIAQRNWNSGIDYNGDGYTEITRKNLKVGGLQAWYAPTPGTRLRPDLQVTDETRRGGNRLDQPEYLANIAESLDTKYRRGSVSWDQEVNADVDFRLAYAFADIDRDSFYGGLGDVVTDPSAPGHDPSQLDPNVAGSAASRSWRQYGRTHNPLHYIDSQLNWRLGARAGLRRAVQARGCATATAPVTGSAAVLEDATFHNLGAFIRTNGACVTTSTWYWAHAWTRARNWTARCSRRASPWPAGHAQPEMARRHRHRLPCAGDLRRGRARRYAGWRAGARAQHRWPEGRARVDHPVRLRLALGPGQSSVELGCYRLLCTHPRYLRAGRDPARR